MSKIENIVPPLELCKQIPAGEFEDSVFVHIQYKHPEGYRRSWRYTLATVTTGFYVSPRSFAENSDVQFENINDGGRSKIKPVFYPSPTLEEILDSLADLGASFCTNGIQIDNRFYEYPIEAEEALRLWFKVKGIDVK